MAHHVFISYSSQDASAAQTACSGLESAGVVCWMAPRDILPGLPYGEALNEAIDESRIMVLILSARSNASRQVMLEVESAVSNSLPIVPLRIEDVQLSKSLKHFLKSIHWFDAVQPPLEKHLPQFVEAVKRHLKRQGIEVAARSGTSPSPKPSKPADEPFAEMDDAEDTPTDDDYEPSGHMVVEDDNDADWEAALKARKDIVNSLGQRLRLAASLDAPKQNAETLHISTTCVSNEEFQAYIRAGGDPPARHKLKGDLRTWDWRGECPATMLRHPVIHVTHAVARRFCEWLTEKERAENRIDKEARYTLPTYAQWRALARGLKLSANAVIDRQWQSGQYQPTEPVDAGEPSPSGLYNMLGNVFEWCADAPQERPVKVKRPDGSSATWKQECFVAVGGGWASTRAWLDEKIRKGQFGQIWCPGGTGMKDGGFRVCLISKS